MIKKDKEKHAGILEIMLKDDDKLDYLYPYEVETIKAIIKLLKQKRGGKK